MVRAGNENELVKPFADRRVVGIGWAQLGDLSLLKTRDNVKAKLAEDSGRNPRSIPVDAGQVYRFVHEIKIEDIVLSYDKTKRQLPIGRTTGDCHYDPKILGDDYPNTRNVEWQKSVSRDDFSTSARNSMGSTLTVFNLDEHRVEIEAALKGKIPEKEVEEEALPPYHLEVETKATGLIADQLYELEPLQFQELVAAVLRSMGYSAKSGGPGADQGLDVKAGPDGLYLQDPRIRVQVKARQDQVGRDEISSFVGTLRAHDRGLYVSLGGFSRDARHEAERSNQPVTVLDMDDFVRLLLHHYDRLEIEARDLIPLKKVYVPTRVS